MVSLSAGEAAREATGARHAGEVHMGALLALWTVLAGCSTRMHVDLGWVILSLKFGRVIIKRLMRDVGQVCLSKMI